MKRLLSLALALIFILCGCTAQIGQEQYTFTDKNAGKASLGIWFSFSEINSMLLSENGFEAELRQAVENCRSLKAENVYIHVRSYCDSLFPSDYFPLIAEAENYGYDVFDAFLKAFREAGIKVHAWINPYRVLTSSSDIEKLSNGSPAYKWLKDNDSENDRNVCFWQGIYLNPAETEVRKLVIDGIRELMRKYEVDGIHFDDYFYPTADPDFDRESYEAYCKDNKHPLSLEDWRRANVNALISGCYTAIKAINGDTVFSISPAASIENNYTALFADVEEWVQSGYVDTVIPQLYFGFDYPTAEYRFEKLLLDWKRLVSCNPQVELLIGLASYKIGTDTAPDNAEWEQSTDIIPRQAKVCFEDGVAAGYVLFSYSSVFSDRVLNQKQRQGLLEIS